VRHDPLTGRVLDGKYVLGPRIGQGAIGRVYRATQLSLDREVAVKVLNPNYTHHPEAIARLRLEARAASRISHPGIVTILDWGKDPNGLVFLVIEYMKGRDLFDVAKKEGPLECSRIARLIQQVALALAHAHEHGIIHRDLKPENLRVLTDPLAPPSRRELVKIYDFGVAHVTRGLTRVFTKVGVMVGTPYYMSPEQATSAEAVPQSDLYSCGVVMFLLATGTLPFNGSSPLEVAAQHVEKPPPRPSTLNPRIDARLEAVILACLAKKPADRPVSGAELAAMLEPIARGDAPPRASARVTGSHPRSLSLAACCAMVVFSAMGGFTLSQYASAGFFSPLASPAAGPALPARNDAGALVDRAPSGPRVPPERATDQLARRASLPGDPLTLPRLPATSVEADPPSACGRPSLATSPFFASPHSNSPGGYRTARPAPTSPEAEPVLRPAAQL
jgi:serine/threonine-protein kinase